MILQASFIGIDGCKVGWISAKISTEDSENHLTFSVFSTIKLAWPQIEDASRILIDIPIGLTERKIFPRECDHLARKALGWPRSASIFPSPCRNALYANTYEQANELNRKYTKKGLSKQAWNISPKILEVDLFIRKNLRLNQLLWESHPEVCFWALNKQEVMKHSKKKPEGFEERLKILKTASEKIDLQVDFDSILHQFPRSQVQKDDLLDALVLALTATEKLGSFKSFPENPTFDERNIPQRIVYSSLAKKN
ncbi:MAG: DUF429 domain-containing protein [Promethearchaeota archaeon]